MRRGGAGAEGLSHELEAAVAGFAMTRQERRAEARVKAKEVTRREGERQAVRGPAGDWSAGS